MVCDNKNTRVLNEMARLTSEETWYRALKIPDDKGMTPLHAVAASDDRIRIIKSITDSVTAQHLIHLLRITDNRGNTPLQSAEELSHEQTAELLSDYQTKALIDIAQQQTGETGTTDTRFWCITC